MASAMAEPALDVRELSLRHATAVFAVHLDRWRHGAREEAAGGFHGDLAVGARFIRCRVEAFREAREELRPAEERTGDSSADAQVMTAARRQAQLGIVRRNSIDFGGGHAEVRGDLGQRVVAEPAVCMLDGLERRQEPRPFAWKLREDGIERFDHEGWGG